MNRGAERERPRRALILAGGGLKVAFQAGVLQVWLDEAGLSFDHVDAASGGVFQLAMMCQGMSGTRIADSWRGLNPRLGIDVDERAMLGLLEAESLFTLDAFRTHAFAAWGLDWAAIRASALDATFNVYNFSKHQLEVVPPQRMSEDLLVACVSLPMWFPPVRVGSDLYIDSVFVTDANVEEAIRRGADEIWIIWTVSRRGEWSPGFISEYFQIIESSANGHLRRVLRDIEENNAALARGEPGAFGREIKVKMLEAEVPVHYLLNLSQDRLRAAVELGVETARRWCAANGVALGALTPPPPAEQSRLSFTEEMKGYVDFGELDYDRGYRNGRKRKEEGYLMFHLDITVDQVGRFVAEPGHAAGAAGYIRCAALGGELPVERGVFNLFVDDEDARATRMFYRLYFRDGAGRPLTLSGYKLVKDDPGADLWDDTTTLFTRLLRGHVGPEEEAAMERDLEALQRGVAAAGILRIHLADFMKQLTTFRAEAPTAAERRTALVRFGRFFLGKLWDVYASHVLSPGPV